jgi:HEPN domain-containing protein
MTGKRKAEATRWYRQAVYDLKAARWNIEGGFHDTACFLAQQAGEKALKSLLYYSGARRQALLTHSIVEMIGTVEKKVPGLKETLEEARELDLHYIPSRYPNGLPSGYPHQFYGKETSEKAVNGAAKILELVTGHYSAAGEQEIIGEADEDQ